MTAAQNHQNRISVLGIGTELTSGQILNRNASWISARLTKMGVLTTGHWVVPDDRPLIREALELAAKTSDLIFVTGGLGPTSDDFTRDIIAEWAGQPLEWDEATWTHIRTRLEARGIPARDSQKQQCYYPRGATILTNNQGTAHGFHLQARQKNLIILPGPPKEIEAIWTDHLESWLPSQFPGLDPWVTRSWDTIAIPESTIAELTERALEGTTYERGYRVHLPYVEVKVSHLKSETAQAAPAIARVQEALAPMTALRDGDDAFKKLGRLLKTFAQIQIQDGVSGEYLSTRLLSAAPEVARKSALSLHTAVQEASPDFDTLVLTVRPTASREARAEFQWKGTVRRLPLKSPYQSALLADRERQYFAEMAALFWGAELERL